MLRQISPREEVLGFYLHLLLGTVIGSLLGILLGASVSLAIYKATGSRLGVVGTFYSPLFWAWSVLLGFFINRFLHHRSAPWIWVAALAYFIAAVLWDVSQMQNSSFYRGVSGDHIWKYELHVLLTLKDEGSKGLEQLLVTVPVLTAIAYSLGAWLGRKYTFKRESQADEITVSAPDERVDLEALKRPRLGGKEPSEDDYRV